MSAHVAEGCRVLKVEADAILAVVERLGVEFDQSTELISKCKGKVVLTGMGKSGQIARKIASTFTSTGTPAVFLHPAESSHGDLGVISDNDVVLAISYGGGSNELSALIQFVARRGIPMIAMTSKPESTLGQASQLILDISVKEEACPLGLAPTSSSTVTLALGDALAMAVLKDKGFQAEDFAQFHPSGALGRKLTLRVKDVMHSGEALPLVHPKESMSKVISAMTSKDVRGVAGVITDEGRLVGVVTDGDIRRRLEKSSEPLVDSAEDLMSRNPKTIDSSELAEKAVFLMQQFQIQLLFVVDKDSEEPFRPIGLIHLQDLLKTQVL
ncbi:MAG TPA: D-arabinose 5-phosphate isomerase [Bdellovibrionales bacterium]|nr:D-arabinose 5-phosphate isomerase [Thioclava sp.]HAG91618.1 D-arabinose 5-phosphate isomerase [Bdellovibrionales bacterium]|tara:strand:+ start:692 stop:1672 length:981 start_codon:yes stop_codon:yes gene_type:complete